MLKVVSSLYTQAQYYGYGTPGFMGGLQRAYQQGKQIAESPQAAWNTSWSWLAQKIDRFLMNRARGGKPVGSGSQVCAVCNKPVSGMGVSRTYKGNEILLCPQHAEMFDNVANTGSPSHTPKSPAPKPPATPRS